MSIQLLLEFRTTLLTKTTAAQNEVALSYHSVCGLYFVAVAFAVAIITSGSAFIYYRLQYDTSSMFRIHLFLLNLSSYFSNALFHKSIRFNLKCHLSVIHVA